MKLFMDGLGWVGAITILLAYALVSTRRLGGTSFRYQGLNLVGSIGLGLNTWFYAAYPSTIVNVVWAGIALMALWRYRLRRPAEPV